MYACLLPIIAGVSLASLKELSFTYKSLYGALTSNIAFASRAVLSKKTMDKPVRLIAAARRASSGGSG